MNDKIRQMIWEVLNEVSFTPDAPFPKYDKVQTGYMGGYSGIADNQSAASVGRFFPVDYFSEFEEDEDEELLSDVQETIDEAKTKNLQVSQVLDDDDRDEFAEMSSGGVAGASVPLGREADGSHTTPQKLQTKRSYFIKSVGGTTKAKTKATKKPKTKKAKVKKKSTKNNKKFIRWY